MLINVCKGFNVNGGSNNCLWSSHSMAFKTLNLNNVTLTHRASFLICFGAYSTIGSLASLHLG